MCTSPILIRNRKFRHLPNDVRASYIKVPCGKCDECIAALANDIYVRARYEYNDCLENGGNGFMCTLTYSDALHPMYNGQKVFNKKHVIDFIKRLRTHLDRFYKLYFDRSAPKFKYFITAEFGQDPTRTMRAHYHPDFFFKEHVSPTIFKMCFERSLSKKVGKKVVPVFGYIYQCDELDPSRGGIKYSGKYVLKDLMYEPQRKLINNRIKYYTDYVNSKFHIIPFPSTSQEEFSNKCIRSTKEYKQAIAKYVLPYRHMLQFYLLSNDLGVSAIVRKYGENLINMPCLNFEGFPFSLPKQVKKRICEDYGDKKCDELNKSVFVNYLTSALDNLVISRPDILSNSERNDLLLFAKQYVQPLNGSFVLVNPSGVNYRDLQKSPSLVCFDDFISDCEFFCANDFYDLRFRLLQLISIYESPENLEYRASIAFRKREEKRLEYEKKRKNKPIYMY